MTNVKLVSDAQALQSMRASDFDASSAYGEVVDNALEAGAKNIRIRFEYSRRRGGAAPLEYVAFGDDGFGMEGDVLHRSLQLGYSSRFNSRKGIGRFGVGSILAAINQCQRVDLFSKTSQSEWRSTYVDLEEIAAGSQDGIPEPQLAGPPEDLANLVGVDAGTLVLWRKHDKQDAPGDRIMEEFTVWAGRTYRRFIWRGVNIYINGSLVKAIDPLYVKVERTAFPEDPPAHEYAPMQIEWPIPNTIDRIDEPASGNSKVEIRMSLLPKELRPNQGAGGSKEAKERRIHMNEGVSIMRNDREVFYGHIPWWPGNAFAEIDRWWGAEISFDAVLDYSFSVKNIKRGAVPLTELKKSIADKIEPTRKSALEKVRAHWNSTKEAGDREGERRRHEDAERAAEKGDPKLPRGSLSKHPAGDEEVDRFTEEFFQAKSAEEKARLRALFRSQPFTIEDGRWKGGDFVEIKHLGGNDVLIYNASHRFHEMLAKLEGRLEASSEGGPGRDLRSLIDLLLISFAKAETMLPEDQGAVEKLRQFWGIFLKEYIEAWRVEDYE